MSSAPPESHSHTPDEPSPLPAPKPTSSFFTYPVSYAVSGLIRRLSFEPENTRASAHSSVPTSPLEQSTTMEGVFTPPWRHGSPFQPPPLTPLSLNGYATGTAERTKLLSKTLAEEIRLLFPARLQLVEDWHLAYSLEQNGVSLATLYKNCDQYRGKRGGYVLVVKDTSGGVCRPSPPTVTMTTLVLTSTPDFRRIPV